MELGFVRKPESASSSSAVVASIAGSSGPGRGRKINQLDMISHDFIRAWDSVGAATKALNITLQDMVSCLQGKTDSAGGFCWKYVTSESSGNIAVGAGDTELDEDLATALREENQEIEDDLMVVRNKCVCVFCEWSVIACMRRHAPVILIENC